MFSGIIEHTAKIISINTGVFRVENTFSEPISLWQSIAHDGACMTITTIEDGFYEFFAMEESFRVTNFWTKKVGDIFNVERCLKIGERLDGHFVTGHIDTVWKVWLLEKKSDNSLLLWVEFDKKYSHLIIEKGSITLNWTSLTLIDTHDGFLSVSLIPLTQDWTNLGNLQTWDIVNIEFDMIAKIIAKQSGK